MQPLGAPTDFEQSFGRLLEGLQRVPASEWRSRIASFLPAALLCPSSRDVAELQLLLAELRCCPDGSEAECLQSEEDAATGRSQPGAAAGAPAGALFPTASEPWLHPYVEELLPEPDAEATCEKLLSILRSFATHALPPGWEVREFGSYVQGTCLPGGALDIALVCPGAEGVAVEAVVQSFALVLLLARPRCVVSASGLRAAAGKPVRLLAGDFEGSRWVAVQELALFAGRVMTGLIDKLLRQLLRIDRRAKRFVMLVKQWARSRGLVGVTSGSFVWTMLAVFALQREGLLPPASDIGQAATPVSATADVSQSCMMRKFAELLLHYAISPEPRPAISLWTGSFVLVQGDLRLLRDMSLPPEDHARVASILPASLVPMDNRSLNELRLVLVRLRQVAGCSQAAEVAAPAEPADAARAVEGLEAEGVARGAAAGRAGDGRPLAGASLPGGPDPWSQRAAEELLPGPGFEGTCSKLLCGLRSFAAQVLPPGWEVREFGSYVQGTCLPGGTLDIALVHPAVEGTAVEAMVRRLAMELLHARPRFMVPSPLVGQAARGPVRVLAGNFTGGRWAEVQEIALFAGTTLTGHIDKLLRQLLSTDSRAKHFVMLVKHWARSRGLVGLTGGTFVWTVRAVFALQWDGVIPPASHLGRADAALRVPAAPSLRSMARRFAEMLLHYAAAPEPKPDISLWSGSFAPMPGLPARESRGAPGLELPAKGPERKTEVPSAAASPDPATGHRAVAQPWSTPPRSAPRHWSALTPGALGREASSGPSDEGSPAAAAARLAEVPAFPGVSSALLDELSALRGGCTVEGVAPDAAGEEPRVFRQRPPHLQRRRWRITESWVAQAHVAGHVVERRQLDAALAGALGPRAWEHRFNRREQQIMLGKLTSQYAGWAERFAQRGQREGDPRTPRVAVQNSKGEFEQEYLEWRRLLHRVPTA